MKPILLILAMGGLLALAGDGARPAEVGRYQLYTGHLTTLFLNGKESGKDEMAVILRLDSVTGRTWVLTSLLRTNKLEENWRPIKEPGEP
jgi:hypothetical protein